MSCLIPGTVLEKKKHRDFLSAMAGWSTAGPALAQIRKITGLQASAIQNWVKRGWVPSPTEKHYHLNQVARIFMINALRGSMQLEAIAGLLSYVNGNLLDSADDTIEDSRLYQLFCGVTEEISGNHFLPKERTEAQIACALADYREPVAGAKERLGKALFVMALSYQSGLVKEDAGAQLSAILGAEKKNEEHKKEGVAT